MKFYLYSCQDLIIKSTDFINLKANHFYSLEIDNNEYICVYSTYSAGCMALNCNTLTQKHNQINYYTIDDNTKLLEIKPFINNENTKHYIIEGSDLKLSKTQDGVYIYFNNHFYGFIKNKINDIKFEKLQKNQQQYGLIYLFGNKKYLIFFNKDKIVFCGEYVDNEILKNCLQIYKHTPNIFNVGNLIKYDFENKDLSFKAVCDKGEEYKQLSPEFNIAYFLEAIKCGRYKYAYNKLSFELKAEIKEDVLRDFFGQFDSWFYLSLQDAYVTIKNHKVNNIYHFVVKNNLIDSIY